MRKHASWNLKGQRNSNEIKTILYTIDKKEEMERVLLEYLYKLSDVQVVKRIQTDVAFRWFLGLTLYDKVPADSTIRFFRNLTRNACRLII